MTEAPREKAIVRLMMICPHPTTKQRRIYAEGVVDAIIEAAREGTALPQAPAAGVGVCGLPGRTGVCVKPQGHGQRHRYGKPEVPPPPRAWEPIDSATIEQSGRRRVIKVGNPVGVVGEGRRTDKNPAGSVGEGYTVLGIERHRESGKVNVEVRHKSGGHIRTFPLDKIVYKRPKGGA